MGKVSIVGAGCGSIDLLSIRGLRRLQQAQCILYDRLIDPALLSYCSPACECIYVGKRHHHHSLPQDEINALLVEKARQYEFIVRLKGGDPYVFGRGGEEALYLKEHGIGVEVVPGITSAIAGLSCAGIPITHRHYASGFRVMSSFTKEGTIAKLDYASMAATSDTLVFLMGLRTLDHIVEQLLLHKKPEDTPIACISCAGSPNQRTLTSTLKVIATMDRSVLRSPTLIVVGDVVNLRTHLNFYEESTLFQKRYLLPIFRDQSRTMADQLQEQGAFVEVCLSGYLKEYEHALEKISLRAYTYIIFTSKRGVTIFFKQLFESGSDVRSLAHMQICVIGDKTKLELCKYGLQADIVSDVFDSEHFAACLSKRILPNQSVLLVKAENKNTYIKDTLSKHCAVQELYLYRSEPLAFQLSSHMYDGMIFTCAFHVHNIMKQLTQEQKENINMYAIGPSTTYALTTYGIQHIRQAKQATLTSLYDLIINEVKEDVLR